MASTCRPPGIPLRGVHFHLVPLVAAQPVQKTQCLWKRNWSFRSNHNKQRISFKSNNRTKKDVYRALFAQFYRLSGIFAHPVGTVSTSNNSRSWIPFLMGSLHIQSEQGPTSNNFRSWTQVLLASLATSSQLFVDTLVTTFQIPNARHACDAPRIAVHTRHMLVASTVSGLDAAGAHSQWHPRH